MPKILITGNGFDINYGLPTFYSDFINILSYIINNQDYNFEDVYSKTKNYNKIKESYEEFELPIEEIRELRLDVLENFWFDFFFNEYGIETWIDFETKINKVLILLSNGLNKINKNLFNKQKVSSKNEYHLEIFSGQIEEIAILSKLKIIETRADFFVIKSDYFNSRGNFYTEINLSKLINFLIMELDSFKGIFIKYFKIFVYPFYVNSKTTIDETSFINITNHYTFNYTPSFEKFYKSCKTFYLHGNIESENIVLGVNNLSDNITSKTRCAF